MIHYDSLLQNATDIITKCDSYFTTKCGRSLLQNAIAILLQNATEVFYEMRQVFYYKMRQFYDKIRQLLQNATFITNCDSTTLY